MNKNILNLTVFAVSFILIFMFAFPLFTGKGYPVLDRPSILSMFNEYNQLKKDSEEAEKLYKYSKQQENNYKIITEENKNKLNDSLPTEIDDFRILNDILGMIAKHNLSSKLPSHSIEQNNNNPNVVTHIFSVTLAGDVYDFFRFLDDLYIAFPIYNYKSVSFSSGEEVLKGDAQQFNLTFETYQSKKPVNNYQTNAISPNFNNYNNI
ncbi:MAG: hypothetical protein QM532_00985 [Cyanobium sp. MAG06]|nr:hypothetical protein [Cyanobium sp. MAG06]